MNPNEIEAAHIEEAPLTQDENSELNNPSNKKSQLREVYLDYVQGFLQWPLWTNMAYSDIRRRYRRTVIGPFWSTLSLGIFIMTMGILFSTLWHNDIKTFLPYFGSGFVCWTFFSTVIIDSCSTFTSAEGLLTQLSLPYAVLSWMIIARNFLIFLHQFIIYILIAIFFHVRIDAYTLLIIPGFLLLFLTGSWLTLLLGLICARYRDIQQVVISLLQISMFVTPIFWPVKQLGHSFKAYLLVNANPLYHYVSILRQPLLGQAPTAISWIVTISITVIGWLVTMAVMSRQYRKLIYWLI